MKTIGEIIEEYGDSEGLELYQIPKNLLDKFAIKLFADTPLAGDKSKQNDILDTMINTFQTIEQQYDLGLIDDFTLRKLAENWDNDTDPYADYLMSELAFPSIRKDLDSISIRK